MDGTAPVKDVPNDGKASWLRSLEIIDTRDGTKRKDICTSDKYKLQDALNHRVKTTYRTALTAPVLAVLATGNVL